MIFLLYIRDFGHILFLNLFIYLLIKEYLSNLLTKNKKSYLFLFLLFFISLHFKSDFIR